MDGIYDTLNLFFIIGTLSLNADFRNGIGLVEILQVCVINRDNTKLLQYPQN